LEGPTRLARRNTTPARHTEAKLLQSISRVLFGVAALVLFALITYFTLSPIEERPHVAGTSTTVEHFLAFTALGFCLGVTLPKQVVRVLIVMVVVAVALELLQYAVPSRHPRAMDAAVKVTAGVAGAFVAYAITSALAWISSWRRRSN
jgi:VanZ family protein